MIPESPAHMRHCNAGFFLFHPVVCYELFENDRKTVKNRGNSGLLMRLYRTERKLIKTKIYRGSQARMRSVLLRK